MLTVSKQEPTRLTALLLGVQIHDRVIGSHASVHTLVLCAVLLKPYFVCVATDPWRQPASVPGGWHQLGECDQCLCHPGSQRVSIQPNCRLTAACMCLSLMKGLLPFWLHVCLCVHCAPLLRTSTVTLLHFGIIVLCRKITEYRGDFPGALNPDVIAAADAARARAHGCPPLLCKARSAGPDVCDVVCRVRSHCMCSELHSLVQISLSVPCHCR